MTTHDHAGRSRGEGPRIDGWVHSVETGGTADGPGIRYV